MTERRFHDSLSEPRRPWWIAALALVSLALLPFSMLVQWAFYEIRPRWLSFALGKTAASIFVALAHLAGDP